jgi:hypothetical protein
MVWHVLTPKGARTPPAHTGPLVRISGSWSSGWHWTVPDRVLSGRYLLIFYIPRATELLLFHLTNIYNLPWQIWGSHGQEYEDKCLLPPHYAFSKWVYIPMNIKKNCLLSKILHFLPDSTNIHLICVACLYLKLLSRTSRTQFASVTNRREHPQIQSSHITTSLGAALLAAYKSNFNKYLNSLKSQCFYFRLI